MVKLTLMLIFVMSYHTFSYEGYEITIENWAHVFRTEDDEAFIVDSTYFENEPGDINFFAIQVDTLEIKKIVNFLKEICSSEKSTQSLPTIMIKVKKAKKRLFKCRIYDIDKIHIIENNIRDIIPGTHIVVFNRYYDDIKKKNKK
jgi:hypothetical protein